MHYSEGELNRSSPIKHQKLENLFWDDHNHDYIYEEKDINRSNEINSLKDIKDLEEIKQEEAKEVLHNDSFHLDLKESKQKFDRLWNFSKCSNEDYQCSPIVINPLSNKSNDSPPVETQANKDLILSSNQKVSCKMTESRDQISDRVSKFYHQQKTEFSNEKEAFDLIRKNLYPSFLNNKENDIKRRKSIENSKACELKFYDEAIATGLEDITNNVTSSIKIDNNSTNEQRSLYYQRNVSLRHNYSEKPTNPVDPCEELNQALEKDKTFDKVLDKKEKIIKNIFEGRNKKFTENNQKHSTITSSYTVFQTSSKHLSKSKSSRYMPSLLHKDLDKFKFGSIEDKISDIKQRNMSRVNDRSLSKSCISRATSKSQKRTNKISNKAKNFAKNLAMSKTINLNDTPENGKFRFKKMALQNHVGLYNNKPPLQSK